MRKTKVAFFSDILIEGFDGAQRTMFHIIQRIPRNSYEYSFICGDGPGDAFDFEVLDIPKVTIPFNQNYSMAMPAFAYFKIRKALDNFRPDVIHIASPSFLGKFALEYARSRSIPVISIYHTHFISYVDYYLKHQNIFSKIAKSSVIASQRSFYNKCSMVLVPTEQIKEELIEHGFNPALMKIWRRGIDHSIFNPKKQDRSYLENITGNNYVNLLFASRLVWEKNLSILIDIYNLYEEIGMRINFIIAGNGMAKKELQRKMPNAVFLGNVSQQDLAVIYASADVFLFPSVSETYGNVVVEAMASGCPCVIGKGGGTQSHIKHGFNGFLCKPDDPNDFYKYIQMVIGNDTLRASLINEGIKYAKTLDWDNLVKDYLSIIDGFAKKVTFIK